MGIFRYSLVLVIMLAVCTAGQSQNATIVVQPVKMQRVGDTTTVSVWLESGATTATVRASAFNPNTSSNVQKVLTYDPATGFYTGRFPFTGFPNGTFQITIGGSIGIFGAIDVVHDASLVITPDALPQIVLTKPIAHSVADPLVPAKANVTDNTDSARLLFTLFNTSTSTYTLVDSWWDSVNTDLDLSPFNGLGQYLLVQAIDSNQQATALTPMLLYSESSPYLSKYFESDSRILDFNYGKLLVIDDGPLANPRIFDVPGGTSVSIPYMGKVNAGYLTPQGAVISCNNQGQDLDSLFDYNGGTLYPVSVAKKGSLKVAGNYSAWTNGNSGGACNVSFDSLWLRDLVAKTDVIVDDSAAYTVNGRNTVHSLYLDGSVAYVNADGGLNKYKNGVNTILVANTPCVQTKLANPVHDSVSFVYTSLDATMSDILWSRFGIFVDMANAQRRPGRDYLINGKYMAYVNLPLADPASAEIYRADTFNTWQFVTSAFRGAYIEGLTPDGDLMYGNTNRTIAFQAGGTQDISSRLGKPYYYNNEWYIAIGNTLFKVNLTITPDVVSTDTIEVAKNTSHLFSKDDFVNNFGPSALMAVKITALPLHGTLFNDGNPVSVNDVIQRVDLVKLTYEPITGFTGIDTIMWNGFNGFAYAAAPGLLKMMIISSPAKPAITGVQTGYCDNLGAQKVRITNWPDTSIVTVSAKLDASPLTVNAADSSVSFNITGLAAGSHSVTVTFTNIAGANDTVATFNVTAAVTPEVNVSANITNVVNLTSTVIVTAANAAGGGTTPLYTFAKDKAFTNILQAEGTAVVLNIDPSTLAIGDNKVYVRMKTSATCYTVQTNIDSILIRRDAATGIVDPANPGQVIMVAPNPFGSEITVKGLNSGKAYRMVVFNSRGQALYTSDVKNKNVVRIPAGKIPAGVYWLSVYDDKKKLLGTEKIVKY